jgi:hypothetical protein
MDEQKRCVELCGDDVFYATASGFQLRSKSSGCVIPFFAFHNASGILRNIYCVHTMN